MLCNSSESDASSWSRLLVLLLSSSQVLLRPLSNCWPCSCWWSSIAVLLLLKWLHSTARTLLLQLLQCFKLLGLVVGVLLWHEIKHEM